MTDPSFDRVKKRFGDSHQATSSTRGARSSLVSTQSASSNDLAKLSILLLTESLSPVKDRYSLALILDLSMPDTTEFLP